MGLRKPRELTSRTCQSKYHAAFKVFARCTHKLLYILLDFQVSEELRLGPEFSHNYTVGYIIIT